MNYTYSRAPPPLTLRAILGAAPGTDNYGAL
jgi:hypothetical protein